MSYDASFCFRVYCLLDLAYDSDNSLFLRFPEEKFGGNTKLDIFTITSTRLIILLSSFVQKVRESVADNS